MRGFFKESYFREENLEKESENLIRDIYKYGKKKSFEISKSALLVLDMQKYFLSEDSHAFIPSAKAIVQNIKSLQNVFLKKGLPVIQTKHLNTLENAGQMKRWWKDLIYPDNPLSDIIDDLKDERVVVLEKSQYDAFYKTELEDLLKEEEVDQVVVSGVMTHLCCETTARSAFVRGFEVILPVDATATYNRRFHISSILNLSHGFAIITKTRDIIDRLEETK